MGLARTPMSRDLELPTEDHDFVLEDQYVDLRAHETMRNAVPNRSYVDEAIRRHPTGHAASAHGHRRRRQRTEHLLLVTLEANARLLVGRAVYTPVCLDDPAREMSLESSEARDVRPAIAFRFT